MCGEKPVCWHRAPAARLLAASWLSREDLRLAAKTNVDLQLKTEQFSCQQGCNPDHTVQDFPTWLGAVLLHPTMLHKAKEMRAFPLEQPTVHTGKAHLGDCVPLFSSLLHVLGNLYTSPAQAKFSASSTPGSQRRSEVKARS